MAYDSARGVTVLFGGWTRVGSRRHGDTWEWDGNAWSLRAEPPDPGPSPRYAHAMSYDAARGVTILFGGYDDAYDGETWEWDGNSWTLSATTGPSPRTHSAMAYDAARGVTVLYGGTRTFGSGPVHYDDTWEWDGATWTQVTTTGTGPREGHAMAYDSARAATVLFGGSGGDLRADTWEYSVCVAPPAGDMNGNCHVALHDFSAFSLCLSVPGNTTPPAGCDPGQFALADLDGDDDVDAADFWGFQIAFSNGQGACCFGDGACTDGTAADCAIAAGTYLGDGTTCATTDCLGACCFASGFCLDLTEDDCTGAGAVPQGIGTECATTECP